MDSEVLSTGDSWIEMSKETSLTWPPPPPLQGAPDSPPRHGLSNAQLELFHKLGYSAEQVQKVLRQFGPALDTDKLLEKLVEVGEAEHWSARAAATVRMNVPVTQAEMRVQVPGQAGRSQSPEESGDDDDPFRPIVIDGSNVAMSHGNKEVFSCLGIQLAVAFFLERGHKRVTAFVPSWRSEKPRPDVPISDQHILRELERKKLLVFTPSKRVGGKRIVCHDDRYIVKLAFDTDGLIVSNDMYRDLQRENPEWKLFIEERLIMFSFVNDKFMPPDDPMGRHGPSLDDLRLKCPVVQKKQNCPYGRKCTFGIKCRFLHPDRPKQSNQSLADELRSRCSLPPPTPAPGHSLSLVEDMAKKMTLGGSTKKDHTSETSWTSHGTNSHATHSHATNSHAANSHAANSHAANSHAANSHAANSHAANSHAANSHATNAHAANAHAANSHAAHSHATHSHGKGGHGKKSCSKCERKARHGSLEHASVTSGDSHELDSGLGSIDAVHGPNAYAQPHSAPCHGAAPRHGFWDHGVARCDAGLAYNAPPYPNYAPYGGGMQPYSQPFHRAPLQLYWSDPYAAPPGALCGDSPRREQSRASAGHAQNQREEVRKKLLAIFSAQLVDAAMNLNPQLLDPQRLATEIVRLQGRGL